MPFDLPSAVIARRRRSMFHAFTAAVGATLLLAPAFAVPLEKDNCLRLAVAYQELQKDGTAALFLRGPKYAAQHAEPKAIQKVARLIYVVEQIKFRCKQAIVLQHPDRKHMKRKAKLAKKKQAIQARNLKRKH